MVTTSEVTLTKPMVYKIIADKLGMKPEELFICARLAEADTAYGEVDALDISVKTDLKGANKLGRKMRALKESMAKVDG